MAVVFAVVGGAVVGIAVSPEYSDKSYDDYGNYGNYSNYSDAAERAKARIAEKQKDISGQQYSINTYKVEQVNDYLETEKLIEQTGIAVSVRKVREDGDRKIERETDEDAHGRMGGAEQEVAQIDAVLDRISEILKEEN